MVRFSGDPTNPPSFSTENLGGAARRYVMWAIAVGVGVSALAASVTTVSPFVSRWLNKVPGVNAPSRPFAGIVAGGGGGSKPTGWEGL